MTKKTGTILDKIINDVRTNLYEKKKIFSDQDIVNLANEKSRKIISLTNRIRQKSPLFPKNANNTISAKTPKAHENPINELDNPFFNHSIEENA